MTATDDGAPPGLVGFVGTGTIGAPMARRLVDAGHSVRVFDPRADALAPLLEAGAEAAADVATLARGCETVLLSLPGPAEIEEVVAGPDGLLAHRERLTHVVDLSTNALALNRRLATDAAARQVHYLDAPVSGGKHAARKGTLSVMVGGDAQAFERVLGLLDCFAEHVFYMGPAGAGTLTKLVNNQIFLCASVLVQEGFVMGASAGMDPGSLLEVLKVSSAGPFMARAPLFLSERFDLDVFALHIAAKDVGVALESAQAVGASMPMTAAALDVYRDALAAGLGPEDFFATSKVLAERAGIELPPLPKPERKP